MIGDSSLAMKEINITQEGLEKLKEELEYLKTEKRQEIAEKIETARGFGDLSENAEYDEAKNEQGQNEGRIAEIEEQLKHVKIVEEGDMPSDTIHVGSKVKILKEGSKKAIEYRIVGPTEADPKNGAISDDCPVGKALLGHKVKQTVEVNTPNGVVKYTIKEIAK